MDKKRKIAIIILIFSILAYYALDYYDQNRPDNMGKISNQISCLDKKIICQEKCTDIGPGETLNSTLVNTCIENCRVQENNCLVNY
ncbi:hypothetical protein C0585_06360 [Candidatus Woesearchaeota archaeon]|nr:MAG: hypothetical protein C0585_06360 [Candidatus Woesearchaeota archaeon]